MGYIFRFEVMEHVRVFFLWQGFHLVKVLVQQHWFLHLASFPLYLLHVLYLYLCNNDFRSMESGQDFLQFLGGVSLQFFRIFMSQYLVHQTCSSFGLSFNLGGSHSSLGYPFCDQSKVGLHCGSFFIGVMEISLGFPSLTQLHSMFLYGGHGGTREFIGVLCFQHWIFSPS